MSIIIHEPLHWLFLILGFGLGIFLFIRTGNLRFAWKNRIVTPRLQRSFDLIEILGIVLMGFAGVITAVNAAVWVIHHPRSAGLLWLLSAIAVFRWIYGLLSGNSSDNEPPSS